MYAREALTNSKTARTTSITGKTTLFTTDTTCDLAVVQVLVTAPATSPTEPEPAEEPYYAWTDEECQAIIERVYAWADKKGYKYNRVSDITICGKVWYDEEANTLRQEQHPGTYGEVYKNSSWQGSHQNCYYNDGKVEMLYNMDGMVERLCGLLKFENEKGHISCIDYDVMSDYIEWAESQGWDTTYTKLLYPPNSIVFIATW